MFGINLFIKADQDGLACPDGWGAKIAGWSEHRRSNVVEAIRALLDVELGDLLTLGYDDLAGLLSQRRGFIAAQFLFPGV